MPCLGHGLPNAFVKCFGFEDWLGIKFSLIYLDGCISWLNFRIYFEVSPQLNDVFNY